MGTEVAPIRDNTMLLELIKCGKSYSTILAVEHLVYITALPGRRRLPALAQPGLAR
jgi:hypothetical protein